MKIHIKKLTRPISEHIIIASDIHIPFQCDTSIAIWVAYMKDNTPDHLVLLGDISDFFSISKYNKDMRGELSFPEEVEEVKAFLQKLRADFPYMRITYLPGNHECFSDDTETLTNTGWKKISDVNLDDMIGSYNTKTKAVEFSKPLAVHSYDYSGEMFSINSRHTSLLVTPNHRMYSKSGDKSPWLFNKMEDIQLNNGRKYFVSSANSLNDEYSLSDDEIKISAWICTYGSIRDKRGVHFYQRASNVHSITNILDSLGWRYSRRDRDRDIKQICCRILLKKPQTASEISLLGKDKDKIIKLVSDSSRLPSWIGKLSQRQFDIFLRVLIEADGSIHKTSENSMMFYGTKEIVDDLQAACIQFGYRSSTYIYKGTQYKLNITKNTVQALDRIGSKVSKEYYSGKVVCITTKNDTVIARRNGKITVTGNSRLKSYVVRHADQFSGLSQLTVPSLLGLRELNIRWHDHETPLVIGELTLAHGDIARKAAGSSARGIRDKYNSSICIGHVHRSSVAYVRTLKGHDILCENPCLAKLDVCYGTRLDFINGFTEVWKHVDGTCMIHSHAIRNGRLITPNGVIYEAGRNKSL